MFCNELVSDAADDGAAVPSASFSENEVVKLAKRPRLFKDISTGTIFFLTRQFVAAMYLRGGGFRLGLNLKGCSVIYAQLG